ncbi:MAG: hypothetical protein DSY58_04385 [Desulfobulbus sp.]|nr:MAG: hypothetical protein DSY58_04385 [Desulfobulbus sp.]
MGRSTIKLVVISLLVAAGVYFWYGRLEKRIMTGIDQPAKSEEVKTADEPVSRNEKAKDPQSGPVDFQIIVKRNIFQAVLEKVKPAPEKVVQKVVPTSLDLTLLGTVAGNEQTARAIIIDNKTKKQDIFQIGDALQGAFIETIERGEITLDVNGRTETLRIKEREGGGPGAPELPDNVAFPQEVVKKPRTGVARRRPRLRRNRRISRRQDPGDVGIEPEVVPDEKLQEIEEPGPAEIPPDEELLPPDV